MIIISYNHLLFTSVWNLLLLGTFCSFSHTGICWIPLSQWWLYEMIIIIVIVCTLLYWIALNCIILYCIILYYITLECIKKLCVILHYSHVIFLFALMANLPQNI